MAATATRLAYGVRSGSCRFVGPSVLPPLSCRAPLPVRPVSRDGQRTVPAGNASGGRNPRTPARVPAPRPWHAASRWGGLKPGFSPTKRAELSSHKLFNPAPPEGSADTPLQRDTARTGVCLTRRAVVRDKNAISPVLVSYFAQRQGERSLMTHCGLVCSLLQRGDRQSVELGQRR